MSPRTRTPHFLLLAGILTAAAAAQTPFQPTGENVPFGPWAISGAADLDGDGDLDVAGPGALLFNDGNGVLSLPPAGFVAPGSATGTWGLVLGDLDGDGDVDALTTLINNVVQVWLNGGSGSFALSPTPQPPLSTGVLHGNLPALGDVDGDGDLDAFMLTTVLGPGSLVAGPPILWLNNGAAVFTDASTQLPAALPVQAYGEGLVEFFDFDLDGDVDIIAADSFGRSLLVNNGFGVFTSTGVLGVGAVLGGGLADVDGDGRLDLIFCGGTGEEIWLNTPSGWNFNWGPAPGFVLGYLALDIDGDGDDEVARLNSLGPSLHDYLPGTGLGAPIQSWTRGYGQPYGRGISADLDGDGDRDLLLEIGRRHRVLLNTGLGAVVEAFGDANSEVAAIGLAGDVEGDGDLDLVGIRQVPSGGQLLWAILNDGRGSFAAAPNGGGVLPSGTNPHLVDLDADGDLDIYAASGIYSGSSGNPGVDRVLINTDAGWLASPTVIPGTGETFTINNGDLDGDGDQDIVLARRSPATSINPPLASLVVRNLGGLTFAPPVPLGPALQSFDLALGDVDGDGDLDVLEANDQWGGTAGTCLLHRNDGTGSFTVDPLFPGVAARAVALGDLDGDADLDAIQGNEVLINDGSGLFTLFATITLPNAWEPMGRMSLADADLDGDLDLVDLVGRYFANLGGGTFSAGASLPMGLGPQSSSWSLPSFPFADFDADGDPDLLVLGNLFHNVTRHLARRGLAGPGRAIYLDLWGPASEPYHLFAAAGPGNTPVPPLGTAWLDLSSLLLVTSGTLDPAGAATLPLAVPPNPSLIGLTLHWQAAVGTAPALTNRILTTALKL